MGGKAASGRNRNQGFRIEEHGLHMWLGWYFNAFRFARDVLEEWRPASPVLNRSCAELFEPVYETALWETPEHPWYVSLPPKPGRPWDRHFSTTETGHLKELTDWLRSENTMRAMFAGFSSPTLGVKRLFRTTRIAVPLLKGLYKDVLVGGRMDFSRIDRYDLREWLIKQGASSSAVKEDPIIRSFYDVVFAYPDGDPSRPAVAAGAGLKTILCTVFGYRGAPLWRMRGSMGDLLFAPAYEVLRKRGVRFEFFHRVTSLHTCEQGKDIERIELTRQARCGSEYAPLHWLQGVPVWPNQPHWDQLESGVELSRSNPCFESIRCDHSVGHRSLISGADFDLAILAIPAPALREITGDLCARNENWLSMLNHTHSVATKAAQLWLKFDPSANDGAVSVLNSALTASFSSFAEMSQTLSSECWAEEDQPKGVLYLCNVLDEKSVSGVGLSKIQDEVRDWVREHGSRCWSPGAGVGELLEDDLFHQAGGDGNPLADQYYRLNVEPSERYVLTLPGDPEHRLMPESSGFGNLYLAGDWTHTSVNGGSVEAAVESGMRAARVITGHPRKMAG